MHMAGLHAMAMAMGMGHAHGHAHGHGHGHGHSHRAGMWHHRHSHMHRHRTPQSTLRFWLCRIVRLFRNDGGSISRLGTFAEVGRSQF